VPDTPPRASSQGAGAGPCGSAVASIERRLLLGGFERVLASARLVEAVSRRPEKQGGQSAAECDVRFSADWSAPVGRVVRSDGHSSANQLECGYHAIDDREARLVVHASLPLGSVDR
jgi:hypothetical protein